MSDLAIGSTFMKFAQRITGEQKNNESGIVVSAREMKVVRVPLHRLATSSCPRTAKNESDVEGRS